MKPDCNLSNTSEWEEIPKEFKSTIVVDRLKDKSMSLLFQPSREFDNVTYDIWPDMDDYGAKMNLYHPISMYTNVFKKSTMSVAREDSRRLNLIQYDEAEMDMMFETPHDEVILDGFNSFYDVSDDHIEYAKLLRSLNKLPENFDGFVYRGAAIKDSHLERLKKLKTGSLVQNDSIISTSQDPVKAAEFLYNPHLGAERSPAYLYVKASGHDISKISKYGEEKEVILNEDKVFQLMKVTEDGDGITHIILEEVPTEVASTMVDNGAEVNKKVLSFIGIISIGGVVSRSLDEENKD